MCFLMMVRLAECLVGTKMLPDRYRRSIALSRTARHLHLEFFRDGVESSESWKRLTGLAENGADRLFETVAAR